MSTFGPAPEELLSALSAEVLDHGERLDKLYPLVVQLAVDVARLTATAEGLPVAVCWVDLDRQAAGKAWPKLHHWVTTVLVVRYPHVATTESGKAVVPPCWYRHPFIVEELSALWVAWCAAYRDPRAVPSTATTWHKQLDEACRRLAPHVSCTSEHEDDTTADPVDDGFDAFVTADVVSRPIKPEE